MLNCATESRLSKAAPSIVKPAGSAKPLQGMFKGQPVETYAPGVAIFWEADVASNMFYILEGVLRVFKILADGRRVITGFIYPGDVLGVPFQDRYLYTAQAITKVRLSRYSRPRFQDMIDRSADLRPHFFSQLCDEMAKAQDQMVLLACKNAEERVSSFLLSIAKRSGAPDGAATVIELPMSRADMADYLGLTIETVSRVMSRLVKDGVIVQQQRHTVRLRDSSRLARYAGDEERSIKHLDARPASRRAVWPQ